ncbi:unnamed protein product [Adineta ricciae]|uniref:AB hydrolase-1 domain-containing protein n=1 Tax=Adineta ricciae TaxID=249248 RepID=A0A814QQY4_ADIRI|nr:unnamed protein product [Adineta ricciae]
MSYLQLPASHQNIKLYYEVHGSGDIKVLFIMGLRTEGCAWKYQTDFFRKLPEFECVSYDNRGCGRTSTPMTLEYTTVQMAKDALELIDHLRWSQCHVVGVSMGGMIALELALLAPRRLLSLTLMATHAGGLIGQAPLMGLYGVLRSLVLSNEEKIVENALAMLYSRKTLNDPSKRQHFFDYHRERFRTRVPLKLVGMFGQMFAVQRHYINYADLLKIRYANFPSLIMVGTEDRLVRETNSYMLQRILGCRLVKLEHAGHDIGGECADQVNQELLALFKSINHKEKSSEILSEYATEIQAVERCCQHRTHCFIHNCAGFIKGAIIGLILYYALVNGLSKTEFQSIHLRTRCIVLIGCLSGFYRSLICIYNALRARFFVQKHRLVLERAASHGGIGIRLSDRVKNGIPHGCGFDIPVLSVIFTLALAALVWRTRQYD